MADQGWSNFSGRVAFTPARSARPKSEAELCALVREAASAGKGVRVAGSGHSFTPLVATLGTLLSLDDWQGIESVDSAKRQAVIRAGTVLHALGEPLLAQGLAMRNMGDVDVQALAGAVSTGTHGTGPTLANVSSQVVAARLVLARASARASVPATARLDGARVSLGCWRVLDAHARASCPPTGCTSASGARHRDVSGGARRTGVRTVTSSSGGTRTATSPSRRRCPT
jgi:FAD/FMN-containing dehydrogenase